MPALLETRAVMEAALASGRQPVLATVALEAYAAASAAFQQQHRWLGPWVGWVGSFGACVWRMQECTVNLLRLLPLLQRVRLEAGAI